MSNTQAVHLLMYSASGLMLALTFFLMGQIAKDVLKIMRKNHEDHK